MLPLFTLGIIVLLPTIPAYFLFKALPTTGDVDGTLGGMKIKLGGAFAGYFAVVVLVLSTHDVWEPPPPPAPIATYQVWDVSGQVTDEQGRAIEPLDVKDVLLIPPSFQTSPGGNFTVTFATMPAPGGGTKYPTLTLNYPNFQATMISLDPAATKDPSANLHFDVDQTRREINLHRIVLQKLPEYSAAGKVPPAPVPAEEVH